MLRIVGMGLYSRPDSKSWWMALERPGQRAIRKSTGVLVAGVTPGHAKEQKQLAEQIYAVAMGDLARGRFKLPTDRPATTFRAFRDWYAENVTVHKRGAHRERSMLRQLGRFFDEKRLEAITKDLALEWRTWRREQVAPATVNREQELLIHMLNVAVPNTSRRTR